MNAFTLLKVGKNLLAWQAMRKKHKAMDFRGKVVLITGGSRGLGFALAQEFAKEEAKLVLCARDQEELDRAENILQTLGVDVSVFVCDVSKRDEVENVVQQVVDRYGHIDVLINNAGIIHVTPADCINLDDYKNSMDTMYFGTVHMSTAVIPHMKRQGEGRIVNISSIGGAVAVPHLLSYTAAKFAVRGYSEGLTAEVAPHGILVSTIIPGLMRTGSYLNATFKGNRESEMNWFALSSAAPLITMSAKSAASKILDACRHGTPEVTLGLPAKILRMLHDLSPTKTIEILSIVNRFLPKPKGSAEEKPEPGFDHETPLTKSALTSLGQAAATKYNERVAVAKGRTS